MKFGLFELNDFHPFACVAKASGEQEAANLQTC